MEKCGTYDLYFIRIYKDKEEDCHKLIHEVYLPGDWERIELGMKLGNAKILDLSSYSTDDLDLCVAMIELGFPTRHDIPSIAPLHREDVEKLWRAEFGSSPMPTIDQSQT